MSSKNDPIYDNLLNLIIRDEGFQNHYLKQFNNKNYEEFKLINDKEKVKFLIDYIFYNNFQNFNKSNNTKHETMTQIETIPLNNESDKAIKKLDNVKDDNKKEVLMKKYNLLNNDNNQYKQKYNEVMYRYKNISTPTIPKVSQNEFNGIFQTLDHLILKTNENDVSCIENSKISKIENLDLKKNRGTNDLKDKQKNSFLSKTMLIEEKSNENKNSALNYHNIIFDDALQYKTKSKIVPEQAEIIEAISNENQGDTIFFIGKDLVDKIYQCPSKRSISLSYTEAKSIGLLLIDYLRLEDDFAFQRNLFEQIQKEKSALEKKFNFIIETNKKKMDLVHEFYSELKMRIEFHNKLLKKEKSSLNNNQLLEEINSNLNLFTTDDNLKKEEGITNFYTKKKLTKN